MRNLLAILSVLAVLYVISCARPAEPRAQAENAAAPRSNAVPPAAVDDSPRITLADAKKEYDAGTAVIVDVRPESAYKEEHIKGSLNITDALDSSLQKLPKGKKIIAYCSWPSEHSSASWVSEAKKKGIENAFALVGGTRVWKDAGYPMEKSR